MNPIQSMPSMPISPAGLPGMGQAAPTQSTQKPFTDFLRDSIQEVNAMQQDADQAVQQLFTGGEVTEAEVLTAVQKADIAFRMMLQVRNKLVSAYDQIQNMRI
jgi:flagellar hook-basal body complex protein FliE